MQESGDDDYGGRVTAGENGSALDENKIGETGIIDEAISLEAGAKDKKIMALLKQQKITIRRLEAALRMASTHKPNVLSTVPLEQLRRCALTSMISPLQRLHGGYFFIVYLWP